MEYAELAWLMLKKHHSIDDICRQTGFHRDLVERMADDLEKQQAVKKAAPSSWPRCAWNAVAPCARPATRT